MSDDLRDADDEERTSSYDYYPILCRGDLADASAVFTAQSLLNRHGFRVPTDGRFDQLMETVVQHFQLSRALPPSGIVDHETWLQLRKLSDTEPAPPHNPPEST